ncbi:hypothetical protein BUALT_Bualt03G0191000 [Buddleja alternifolia]|uniref:Glutaredoxin domain-containing protein n=1 Tax=Buddleja alternifolia TaxID=168488 RepID=A0AAV6XV05_9LAMI|nr:hypothetical protein BUALT_Bualt03G0191000 [Buddleja alternifolia]
MQEAGLIQNNMRWRQSAGNNGNNIIISRKEGGVNGGDDEKRDLKRIVKENAVVVFAKKGCCLSQVAKRLLQGVGANPRVYEVDEDDINEELMMMMMCCCSAAGTNPPTSSPKQLPAVFIGGQWFGGLDRIIVTHITEELTPLLKQAGALADSQKAKAVGSEESWWGIGMTVAGGALT